MTNRIHRHSAAALAALLGNYQKARLAGLRENTAHRAQNSRESAASVAAGTGPVWFDNEIAFVDRPGFLANSKVCQHAHRFPV